MKIEASSKKHGVNNAMMDDIVLHTSKPVALRQITCCASLS